MRYCFYAIITPSSDGTQYTASIPSVPNCTVQGRTRTDVVRYLAERATRILSDEEAGLFHLVRTQDEEIPVCPEGSSTARIEISTDEYTPPFPFKEAADDSKNEPTSKGLIGQIRKAIREPCNGTTAQTAANDLLWGEVVRKGTIRRMDLILSVTDKRGQGMQAYKVLTILYDARKLTDGQIFAEIGNRAINRNPYAVVTTPDRANVVFGINGITSAQDAEEEE